ncbi:hypothetical protein CBL_07297 [Carabus blaptoides fortunei]
MGLEDICPATNGINMSETYRLGLHYSQRERHSVTLYKSHQSAVLPPTIVQSNNLNQCTVMLIYTLGTMQGRPRLPGSLGFGSHLVGCADPPELTTPCKPDGQLPDDVPLFYIVSCITITL